MIHPNVVHPTIMKTHKIINCDDGNESDNGVPVSGPEKPGKLSWIIYIYLSSMNIPFYINRFGGGKLFT